MDAEAAANTADLERARALALLAQGEIREAGRALHRALLAGPGRPDLLLLAAEFLMEQADPRRAEPYVTRAIELEPRSARAHGALAILRQREGRLAEAVSAARAAAEFAPARTPWRLAAFRVQSLVADWRDWHDLPALLAEDPEGVGESECGRRALGLYLSATDDPALQRRLIEGLAGVYRRAAQAADVAASADPNGPSSRAVQPVRRARRPEARVRVGYLSADFREHPLASALAGLLALHDRASFHVVGIATGPPDPGPLRRRIAGECDEFVELPAHADLAVARRIRALDLDVLVDLSGHTTLAQPGVLALRPAPVQIGWLGFPGTVGTRLNDYLLADDWVVPESAAEHYAERVLRLPHSLFPPGRARRISAARPRAHHGLPDVGLVLCSFNATWKITPATFASWLELLRSAPGAVLWLADGGADATANLRSAAHAAGVDPQRLVFAPRVADHAEHLARYRVADLALDTFPYNSHATASDALWAGCPLVTLSGRSFASRVAGSLVRAAGLPDLVTESPEEHRRLLHGLLADRGRRERVRARAEAAAASARASDASTFVRALEAAYLRAAAETGAVP